MSVNKIISSHCSDALALFLEVRSQSEAFCNSLEIEDYGLQAIAETSPAKWHIAHTSWFFETFILKQFERNFEPFAEGYEVLFNSYYNAVGEQFPRPKRGLLSRPTVAEIYRYRANITNRITLLLQQPPNESTAEILKLLILGVNHEQQHQELFFTDLKYNLFQNPLYPSYNSSHTSHNSPAQIATKKHSAAEAHEWTYFEGGLNDCGINVPPSPTNIQEFAFDNEGPLHQCWLQPFSVRNKLVTNREYLAFIESGGYLDPQHWLSDGWATCQSESWQAPLYWIKKDSTWFQFTLSGLIQLNLDEPVCHVSAYEADAFSRWSNARLLTEQEWEHIAKQQPISGNFVESGQFHPMQTNSKGMAQLFGDVWEWTSSAYSAYPGFSCSDGAIGEYNGKFMCNQLILRGGSCVTSSNHIRASYRNFFYPNSRWQFSGIRLAKNEG